MRRRRLSRIVLWGVGVLVLLSSLFFIYLRFLTPKPPIDQISECRKAISEAKKIEAAVYAKPELQKAEQIYSQLILELRYQNDKSIVSRDFKKIYMLANLCLTASKDAYRKADTQKKKISGSTVESYKSLKDKTDKIPRFFNTLPLPSSIRKIYSRSLSALGEAGECIKLGNLNKASSLLNLAENEYIAYDKYVHDMLTKYFSNFSMWQFVVNDAIRKTKSSNSIAIIIVKMEHTLYFYKNGSILYSYPVEFGTNWIGNKYVRGDKTTPEGKYSVEKKIPSNQSKYYKALLLDYPNDSDRDRYRMAVSRGEISKRADIGGEIEIHGDGGKGVDWTQGCIALERQGIDRIFDDVSVGTPVIIVGSVKPLSFYLDE